MAAIVAGGVVLLSLVAGGAFAYLSFEAYKKRRRIPLADEERARNLERTARHLQQDAALQTLIVQKARIREASGTGHLA
jgi:hypothetical protein